MWVQFGRLVLFSLRGGGFLGAFSCSETSPEIPPLTFRLWPDQMLDTRDYRIMSTVRVNNSLPVLTHEYLSGKRDAALRCFDIVTSSLTLSLNFVFDLFLDLVVDFVLDFVLDFSLT